MSKQINIQYSEDGMWGSEGPDGYDIQASYDKFEMAVYNELQAYFPGAEVQMSHGINDTHSVDSDPSSDDAVTVGEIIERVFAGFEWLVEA